VAPTAFTLPRFQYLIWVITGLYIPSYLDGSEKASGRPNKWFKQGVGVFKWMSRRMNMKLVRTPECQLVPDQTYIVGLHPHGVLPFGGVISLNTEVAGFSSLFPEWKGKLRSLAASFCFFVPIYRDMMLAGGMCDAAHYSALKILQKGSSVMLVPGGATEALYSKPGEYKLVLSNRLGFCKLSLESGSPLVPAFSFGEVDAYDVLSPDNKFVHWIKSSFQHVFGISLPLLRNILPRKCDVTTVVGAPIPVNKVEKPSPEQIQALLDVYREKLIELFENNKRTYLAAQYRDAQLSFI